MPRSRSITAPLAIAALLLLAPTLTGCMQNPIEKLVEEGISEAVEGVTGVDVDVSGGKLPDNFPSSVALVDGEVRDAGAITVSGETTFNVTLVTSGTVEEAYADGRARLASAGYEEVVAQQM